MAANKEFHTTQRIGPFAVGEKPEQLRITFKDAQGVVINLTGYTADFIVTAVDDTPPAGMGAGEAAIEAPATAGVVTYAWVAADTGTPGNYRGQMWVGNLSLKLASDVIEWFVRQPVGAAPSI